MKIRFLILILSSLVLGSCQGQKSEQKDALNESYKKIDQGDYSGAISKLEELKTHDQRPEVRIALASAYSARSGVKISDLWNFVQALRAPAIDEELIKKQPAYQKNLEMIRALALPADSKISDQLDRLVKMMTAFGLYREKLETLPYVPAGQREDLRKAIGVLTEVPTKGAHLYRATLDLVNIRSDLKDGFDIWPEMENRLRKIDPAKWNSTETKAILCSLNLSDFATWLNVQFDNIRNASKDIKTAFPSKSQEMLALDIAVQLYQRQLPDLKKSLTPDRCE